MPHWRCTLAYDGAGFHGWQVQPGLRTIQGTLAAALHHIAREHVLPQGSGRTDTGVHALGQVASFTLAAPIPQPNLHRALNRALPPSIRVLTLEQAPPDFHARHSALRKTYEYRLFLRNPRPYGASPTRAGQALPDRICPPTLAPCVWDYPHPISLPRARLAAAHILGTHDFTSFAAADPDAQTRAHTRDQSRDQTRVQTHDQTRDQPAANPHPIAPTNLRTIHASTFTLDDSNPTQPILLYRVTGSGFLHHMVRNLVGTFLDCASGRTAPERIPAILKARTRTAAGPTAPPQGLFLYSVEYEQDPPLLLEDRSGLQP